MAMDWTNPSVQQLAAKADPIDAIQNAARQLVLNAIEQGWTGPPFDPFDLAQILNVRAVPSQDVLDASLTPEGRGYRIDYNPNQSRRRIRFSIAHELAHTLFPDCRDQVRNRVARAEMGDDEWQLEMLCNIAAGEILMPAENLPIGSLSRIAIDDVIIFKRGLMFPSKRSCSASSGLNAGIVPQLSWPHPIKVATAWTMPSKVTEPTSDSKVVSCFQRQHDWETASPWATPPKATNPGLVAKPFMSNLLRSPPIPAITTHVSQASCIAKATAVKPYLVSASSSAMQQSHMAPDRK